MSWVWERPWPGPHGSFSCSRSKLVDSQDPSALGVGEPLSVSEAGRTRWWAWWLCHQKRRQLADERDPSTKGLLEGEEWVFSSLLGWA